MVMVVFMSCTESHTSHRIMSTCASASHSTSKQSPLHQGLTAPDPLRNRQSTPLTSLRRHRSSPALSAPCPRPTPASTPTARLYATTSHHFRDVSQLESGQQGRRFCRRAIDACQKVSDGRAMVSGCEVRRGPGGDRTFAYLG